MPYLLDVRQNDGNLNLKNKFCNWTNVDFSFQLSSLVVMSIWRQNHQIYGIMIYGTNGIPGNYTPVDYKFAHLTCSV